MARQVIIKLDIPDETTLFRFPPGLNQRLQTLLDKRDRTGTLSAAERLEAEGLIKVADLMTLLKLKVRVATTK